MNEFIPLVRRFRRALRFWHNPTFKDLSEKSWQIAPPPEKAKNRSAIYLENQLDKVMGVFTNFDLEYERATGKWNEYRPTTAHLLKSVCLADGFLYKGAMKLPLLPGKERMIVPGDYEKINHGVLASSHISNLYFGHFLQDELPLTLAAQKLGEAFVADRKPYGHEPEYRELFNLYPRRLKRAKFEEFVIIDDISWNEDKGKRYEQLRSQLREQLPVPNPPGAFFRRGRSGSSRVLVNEPEVEDFLAQRGFVILDPQTSSARELLSKSLGAGIVAGVEGSQLVAGLLSVKSGGTVLALQPPYRFNNWYKVLADGIDVFYSFLVGSPVEDGFEIDISELDQTLDLIDAKTNFRGY